MRSLILATGLSVLTGACGASEPQPVTAERASPTQEPASATPERAASPGGCQYGPWADHCPTADWARKVVTRAGHELIGDTGSALEARANGIEYHFWAFEPEGWQETPLRDAIADEGYTPLRRIDGVDVYTDGVRLAWEVHGLYCWLSAALLALDDIPAAAIDELVVTSSSVPYWK
ncbi:MAG: hypothetical protein ABR518_09715 [Actinomycetota bacterium]